MGHIWNYVKPREVFNEFGIAKYGNCWVCVKCRANSSDVDKLLNWLPEDKPPNEVLIETYLGYGQRSKMDCDELILLGIHNS